MDCEASVYHLTICEVEFPLGEYQATRSGTFIILAATGIVEDRDVDTGPFCVLEGPWRGVVRNWVRTHNAGVEGTDKKEDGGS